MQPSAWLSNSSQCSGTSLGGHTPAGKDGRSIVGLSVFLSAQSPWGHPAGTTIAADRGSVRLSVLQGATGDHMALRQRIVSFIRSDREAFEPFVEDEEPFDTYCNRMLKVWAMRKWQSHRSVCLSVCLGNAPRLLFSFMAGCKSRSAPIASCLIQL
jgi:hypothetical protein